jgi:hypothetical protein
MPDGARATEHHHRASIALGRRDAPWPRTRASVGDVEAKVRRGILNASRLVIVANEPNETTRALATAGEKLPRVASMIAEVDHL